MGDMPIDPAEFNQLTHRILSAAIEVHRILGPGMLESIYVPCLQYELSERGLRFESERSIPVVYKKMTLDARFRVDLIVEQLVVVEVKSVAALLPVHQGQAITYMGLTNCPVALLINFNA